MGDRDDKRTAGSAEASAWALMLKVAANRAEVLHKKKLEHLEADVVQWKQALSDDNPAPRTYIELGRCYKALGRYEDAIATLEQGVGRCVPSKGLWREYVRLLYKCNRTRDAIAAARAAARVFPDDFEMKLKESLLLPMLYDTKEELEYYRRRFMKGLDKISAELSLDTAKARRCALEGIGRHVNFLLPYQDRDDVEPQKRYGELVQRIMAANYPQWTGCVPMPAVPPNGKIRIGYVSAFFSDHTVTRYFLGWLEERDRKAFEAYAYHLGIESDFVTEEVRRAATAFRELPADLEGACAAIRADDLHALVLLDVGMKPIMAQIGALRLAPVQCLAWGHPVTSGLPMMDYFLTSALAEPHDGQQHYSERLVYLPGIGACYRKPVVPRTVLVKTREDFGLRKNSTVYLCCQSTFKYLPEHDGVFPEIARRVRDAQFVFLVRDNLVRTDFRHRLDRAFSAKGLEADHHCVLLRRLSLLDYWNLNLVATVFLDTIGWSGGRSIMDAIACGLPVVTLPGKFMRGRQGLAILTQAGVSDTIAGGKPEFIDLAVRLGLDEDWRQSIIEQMIAGYARLYAQSDCVRALENFFTGVVKAGGSAC